MRVRSGRLRATASNSTAAPSTTQDGPPHETFASCTEPKEIAEYCPEASPTYHEKNPTENLRRDTADGRRKVARRESKGLDRSKTDLKPRKDRGCGDASQKTAMPPTLARPPCASAMGSAWHPLTKTPRDDSQQQDSLRVLRAVTCGEGILLAIVEEHRLVVLVKSQ